ncbi:MAG: matrixin family metalloprotease [Phaeodactylibacter sp.]|uniref:matrixin family metalloprotease n=1 Tax=Phaeodactylibacter sp. TaxID=1940289 RepID=UPI0032ECD0FF
MQKLSCLITLLIILGISTPGNTQCSQVNTDLRGLLLSGTTVVEAKVRNASSFRGSAEEMIYTRYQLEVYQVFKGDVRSTIELVTLGGVIGDEAMIVAPSTELQVGDLGIFVLKPAVYTLPRGFSSFMQSVLPQGAVVTFDPAAEEAYLFTGEMASRTAVYQKIAAATGVVPTRIRNFPSAGINRVAMPQIDSITPSLVAAGVGEVVTIHGQGFGEGTGTVFFPNADRGGVGYVTTFPWHVVSWTTTAIAIKVPHKAGTGSPLILTSSGGIGFSPVSINISYAYNNVMSSGNFYEPKLIDHKSRDDGGYLFRLSSNGSHNGVPLTTFEPAIAALNAAAGAWQDSIGLPIYIGSDCPAISESINGSLNDGQNVISFDHDQWDIRAQLGEQVLAATISRYAKCGDSEWELTDVDMVIRRGALFNEDDDVVWSFDGTPAANELDFQSVVLHELGHALQLQHVVNPDGVMHYAASFGVTHHELGFEDDIAGGLHAMTGSRAYDPPALACFPAEHFDRARRLGKYNPGHHCTQEEEDLQIQGLQSVPDGIGESYALQVYPNPKPKDSPLQVSIYMEASGNVSLLLFSNNGQLIAQHQTQLAQGRQTLEWPLPDVPSGFYQLLVQHDKNRIPAKIVIP